MLDWKSNKLGGSSEGFDPRKLRGNAHPSLHFAYHLYAVAAHRFLKYRMMDYSYERNFGGAYYLFVRGMKVGSEKGIYFDLPDLRTIEALKAILLPKMNLRKRGNGLGIGCIFFCDLVFFIRKVPGEEGKALANWLGNWPGRLVVPVIDRHTGRRDL